jgi:uncharacterized membrane protein
MWNSEFGMRNAELCFAQRRRGFFPFGRACAVCAEIAVILQFVTRFYLYFFKLSATWKKSALIAQKRQNPHHVWVFAF